MFIRPISRSLFFTLTPLMALASLLLSCSSIRKVPLVEHNRPGKMEITRVEPGIYDLDYRVSAETTAHEFRRYAAHHVADFCIERGYSYFQVLSTSGSLQGAPGDAGGERVAGREAKGRVRFLKELPADESQVIFDAKDVHDNVSVWDGAGDA